MNALFFPDPSTQISFARQLQTIRMQCMQPALRAAVRQVEIKILDQELSHFVAPQQLSLLAQFGLRGEALFATPCILRISPMLLGYYRLLYGYSQKEFYNKRQGQSAGIFRSMEAKGRIAPRITDETLADLCAALARAGEVLLQHLQDCGLSNALLHELSLLTLGPQLRGGLLNRRGQDGIQTMQQIFRRILQHGIIMATDTELVVKSARGSNMVIRFHTDPDIIIQEPLSADSTRNILAIEVKSGADVSNVKNRIGEAEKSHHQAKHKGYPECWTILNARIPPDANILSPATNRFYLLEELALPESEMYSDFAQRILSMTGIPHSK